MIVRCNLIICDRKFIDPKQFTCSNLNGKKIPLLEDFPDDLVCTSCLLPMQYQSKTQDSYIWQCFKCGKKYFLKNFDGVYKVKESWSSAK